MNKIVETFLITNISFFLLTTSFAETTAVVTCPPTSKLKVNKSGDIIKGRGKQTGFEAWTATPEFILNNGTVLIPDHPEKFNFTEMCQFHDVDYGVTQGAETIRCTYYCTNNWVFTINSPPIGLKEKQKTINGSEITLTFD